MSAINRIPRLATAALAALGLALAVSAPAHAAEKLTADAAGITVTGCSTEYVLTFRLFTSGITCDQALKLASAAAGSDRWCPKGWSTRERVKLDGVNGDKADPYVTLCTRTVKHRRQAFTYHVPTG
jgi:hypothetical protein